MTEQPDESLDPNRPQDPAANAPLLPSDVNSANPDTPVDPNAVGEEGLPEWEPLTPELVEDEAIRGDFVIRWVVVGLALLLGFSQIAESRTLLHLKNGQYLIGHGLLPGAKDVFSHTANDRRWINLSWLFDITMAGIYAVGGGIGLSIIQGVVVGLAFGLLAHSVRPGIRTWWGSICAVLGLLACYPQFTIQPELVTLLGISFVLWTLVQAEEPGQSRRLWGLVPAIWLWAQFDPHAWFGWFLLLLWSAGEGMMREVSTGNEKRLLWKVSLCSLAVVCVHPFLWESWLAPLRMYVTDYPAMRVAYATPTVIDQGIHPIWKPFIWATISHRTIAALVLMAATVVTLILNRAQWRWSHVFAVIGFNLLAVFATHELAVASLVNCVVCTLNAQAWYRERFGQVYSLDWRELLFSRGGRAVTVLGFFALAWLILSGRLDGPDGKRTGIGFDSHLATAMSDYQNLRANLIDDHPFNFSFRQGDLMIWGGEKPFIDSRVGLYSGSGDSNLIDVHHQTRQALRSDDRTKAEVWKKTFDRYQIHQAWPRLNGPIPLPDYGSMFQMLASGNFQLNNLNASTAVCLRTDKPDEFITAYLKDHPFDLVQKAFRENLRIDDLTREWSKPATTYDNLFSLRRSISPGGVQAAQHYLRLAELGSGLPLTQRAACALLAVRHANEGLKNESNASEGYRTLGSAYSFLGQLEASVLSDSGVVVPGMLRYYESVTALHQALALQPDDLEVMFRLVMQYEMVGRRDITLDLYTRMKRLIPYTKSMSEEKRQMREKVIDKIEQLKDEVTRIDDTIEKFLGENADRMQVALGAFQAGCVLKAIKILEDDQIYLAKNPQAKLGLAGWLMESGRGREADEILGTLESLSHQVPFDDWRNPAAISAMTIANYQRSINLWESQLQANVAAQLPPALSTLPFLRLNQYSMGPDAYPASNVAAVGQVMQSVKIEGSTVLQQLALAQMESGANSDAAGSLRRAVQLNPSSPLRPLWRFYLECLTGDQIELKAPAQQPEEIEDLSIPDEKPAAPVEKPESKSDAKSGAKADEKPQ